MIKTGSYMYIRGTNMEVGVRRTNPNVPYAMCVFRYGVRYWNGDKSWKEPYTEVEQIIPTICLTHKCDFDLMRGKLKKKFTHSTLLHDMPDEEGLFDIIQNPDVYDITQCGSKYFHIIKGPTPEHLLKRKPDSLSIFGLQQLTFPFKSYDSATGVVTFDTRPKRQAHISVLRRKRTMALGKPWVWPYYVKPPPYDWGYIRGSNVRVHVVIPHDDISLYKVFSKGILCLWLPNDMICQKRPLDPRCINDLTLLNIGNIYINGLPHPFRAYSANERAHQGLEQPYIYAVCRVGEATEWWRVDTDSVHMQPKKDYDYLLYYKPEEAEAWLADYLRRKKHITRLPIAVY